MFGLLMVSMMTDVSDYDIDDDYNNDFGFDEIDSFFIAFTVYLCGLIIYGLLINHYGRKKHLKARKAIQRLIDRNSPFFAAQGLRWNLPLHFPRWIELWKDYRSQPQCMCMCGRMVPQVNYMIPSQGQMTPQPQVLPFPGHIQPLPVQAQRQPLQLPPNVVIHNPSNNTTYQQRPLLQPLLNEPQTREYVPPNPGNYPTFDQ